MAKRSAVLSAAALPLLLAARAWSLSIPVTPENFAVLETLLKDKAVPMGLVLEGAPKGKPADAGTPAPADIIELTKANFDAEVLKAKGPVVVEFYATWCGACKSVAPLVQELANQNRGIKFGKVDTDAQPDLAKDIKTIPTFYRFKDGKPELMKLIVETDDKGNVIGVRLTPAK